MKNVDAGFAKDKYLQISELGSKLNLSFSSHFTVGKRLIALDGVKNILLVLETNSELIQPYTIELNNVAAVSVKKTYGSIRAGELKNRGVDEFLKRIDLQFGYKGKNKTIALTFYDSETDDVRDLPRLARNAKNWEMILSKVAGSQVNRIPPNTILLNKFDKDEYACQ